MSNLVGPWVRRFLVEYVIGERNYSPNTQHSYRDTFRLFLPFAARQCRCAVDRLPLAKVTSKVIRTFLTHLEQVRYCGPATLNQRLAALRAWCGFVGLNSPEHLEWSRQIRNIHFKKHAPAPLNISSDKHGHGFAVLLQLWSSTVIPNVGFERIALKVPGHSFRYRISGVGLIQLYFGGEHKRVIAQSHYRHWNEAGARQRGAGDADSVDWHALSQLSGRIQRHLRNKISVAKVRGRPILPSALAGLSSVSANRPKSANLDIERCMVVRLLRGS